jgi:hypothetical protein
MIRIAALALVLAATPASANVKAEILCGVLADGKVDYVVPAKDGRKLDRPIDCAIHVTGGLPGKQAPASIYTWLGGPGPMHSGTIAVGTDLNVELTPGAKLDGKTDFIPCQDDFEIVAEIAGEKSLLFSKRLKVHQKCSEAPPPPNASTDPPKSATKTPAEFAAHILEEMPDDDARKTAQRFADAAQNDDRVELKAMCPSGGLRTPKKKITCEALEKDGLAPTGFKPTCCNNEPSCAWAPEWFGYSAKKTSFQVNNRSGCVGSPTPVAAFEKRGGKWIWTGIRVDAPDAE